MSAMSELPSYIVIPDDNAGYNPESLCVPLHYKTSLECILLPGGLVKDRVDRLAQHIVEDMGDEPIFALCILKGGYKFFTDLIDRMKLYNRYIEDRTIEIYVDFIKLKSYKEDKSSGNVQVIGLDDLTSLKGKNILVVEDLIDTGRTINCLLALLKKHGAKSVKVASLLLKRVPINCCKPDYCGFEVPDKFVVGYAIDYNEHFRDLEHVCVVNDYGKKKFGLHGS